MAAPDHPSQRAPTGGALLRAARRAGSVTQASAERTPRGGQEAPGLEIAPFDSGPGSDPRGRAHGHYPDTPSVPHQAGAVEIQWVWGGNAHQDRSQEYAGAPGAIQ